MTKVVKLNNNMGFIKLYRQFAEWRWYQDVNTTKLFIHCLLRANYKETNWFDIIIPKGSFITSLENLSFESGLSLQQTRTSLKKLKSTRELTYKSTNKFTLISVDNWGKFQCDDEQGNMQTNMHINKQITNEQQTTNKRLTTDKEYKEIKEEKEIEESIRNNRGGKNEIKWELIKPELLNSFKPLIEEFIQYRKELKKPMTISSINIFINKLLKLSNQDINTAQELINTAIEKNWQTVYEPKPNQYSPQSKESSNNKGYARPATSATDRFKAMVWGDEWKDWYGAVCTYEDINKVFESNRIELCVDDKFLTNFKGFYDSYNKTNIAMDEAGYMLPTNHFHKPENFRGALVHPFTQTSYSFDSWLAMYVQYLKFRFSDITKVYAGHFDINGKIFDDFLESDWFEDQKIKTNDVARRRAKYINEAEMAKNKLDKEK